ncbi:major facilitator superfamily domain-containing protein [Neohortaea acidophila]|uniref:Major facilitator superfamily domain-containing protein n=1 Tax=Neohortaea acidophila TaxID=245834 RepID=A0A6A6PJM4_9PEZI|nr:major facilitator superfamily domain-containing protein [Neohortaea acidophila]KAF2480250.1 major facilitator superfamily domain-containing protein [Neohortaea acidophila]
MTENPEQEQKQASPEPAPEAEVDKFDLRGAWWQVLGGFLIFFVIWGLPISFGAFQDFYTLHYLSTYPASAIAWIGTVQGALLVAVGLLSGPLYDLGYWRLLYATGAFMCVFGLMMLSLSTEYYQVMLSQGFCIGIGSGLLYIPVLTLIGAAFKKQRALAMGVITSGIALGGIMYTLIYLYLLNTLGFGWMVRVIGFVSLAAFAIAAPTLRLGKRRAGTSRKLFDRAALTDVPFLLFTLAQFFVFLGYLVPLFYIPTFAQVALHTSQSTALYILIGSQGASLFGRLAATYVVRYVGVMVPWAGCCCASGILCFAWIAITEQSGFIAFAVLYGFFSGALVALPPSLFPSICPDPSKLGSRLGISWTSTAVAFLIGSPIAGAVIDVGTADFLGAQVWSGSMLLFSVLLLGALWIMLARKLKRVLI